MYGYINTSTRYKVVVPKFSGGVNYRDADSLVLDNQLTDLKNMWYQQTKIKTRPAITAKTGDGFVNFFLKENYAGECVDFRLTDVYRSVGHKKRRLIIVFKKGEINAPDNAEFVFVSDDGDFEKLALLPKKNESGEDYPNLKNCIAFMHKDKLWVFLEGEQAGCPYGFKYDFEKNDWETVLDDDFYAPTIFINGVAQEASAEDKKFYPNGDLIEGYNLLGNKYKVFFDGYSEQGNSCFVIPTNYKNLKEIVVRHTDKNNKVYTHKITKRDQELFCTTVKGDGAQIRPTGYLQEDCIAFYFCDVDYNLLKGFDDDKGLHNNIEVTVSTLNYTFDIARCRFSVWYGGNASGINGGTRLFLSGDATQKNRIIWSDLNNPLYFPENNYTYIGTEEQAVTAFGKQGEMLVIFKEREIYYTYYVAGENVDAQSVVDQSVIDLAASAAKFPVIQIHSEIGCDCPNTLALCQNRLVWATSDGKIYTLASNNQYSERNVFEISTLLGRKLRELGTEQLKTAYAADLDEHYYLSVGKKIFVLDYGNNGLSYMASYGGYDNAVNRLAWYVWETPCEIDALCCFGQKLLLISSGVKECGNAFCYCAIYTFDETSVFDEQLDFNGENFVINKYKILCFLKTKLFDFNTCERKKSIEQVYLNVPKCNAPIILDFNTDVNESITSRMIKKRCKNMGVLRILPKTPHTSHFGLSLRCDGVFSLEGISINYRLLGSVM